MTLKFNTRGRPLNILNTYIPQNMRSEKEREIVWEELSSETEKITAAEVLLTVGDLNARLHCRLDGEDDIFGPHIFGRGSVPTPCIELLQWLVI